LSEISSGLIFIDSNITVISDEFMIDTVIIILLYLFFYLNYNYQLIQPFKNDTLSNIY
jgi:hypothetical protein